MATGSSEPPTDIAMPVMTFPKLQGKGRHCWHVCLALWFLNKGSTFISHPVGQGSHLLCMLLSDAKCPRTRMSQVKFLNCTRNTWVALCCAPSLLLKTLHTCTDKDHSFTKKYVLYVQISLVLKSICPKKPRKNSKVYTGERMVHNHISEHQNVFPSCTL